MNKIPYSLPYLTGNEQLYINKAFNAGILHGDGPFTHQCESLLAELTDSRKHLLTHSCTGALEMAAMLLNLQSGDEVIMPSYTFVSTANAFILHGGVPVFVDIDENTPNMNVRACAEAITQKTKAIVAVNYGGCCAPLDELVTLSRKHDLVLIEDAAQSIGASYKGRPQGSFGDLATFSFHGTKNIVCGEGGSLAINNPQFIERAEIIREKGTNRSLFMSGQVDKYTWVDKGSSFLPSELSAACLLAQLEKVDEINEMRLKAWNYYASVFAELRDSGRVEMMQIPEGCQHNAHVFYLMLHSLEDRNGFLSWMGEKKIQATFHYVPLHSSPAGKKYARVSGSMFNTDKAFERLVRLPLYPDVEFQRVIDTALSYLKK